MRVRRVDVISPPTTLANGRWTSELEPEAKIIGTRLLTVTAAVISTGRIPEGIEALEGALRLETDPRQAQLIRENPARLRQTPAR